MMPQIGPNFAQDSRQDRPDNAPDPQNPPKTLYCRSFFDFPHFGKDRSKNQKIIQDNSQNDAKIALLVATSAILGRNLLPSDPKKLSKFQILGSFGEVLAPKSPTRHARPLPRAPETPFQAIIFKHFGVNNQCFNIACKPRGQRQRR